MDSWVIFALLSAATAALVAIFGKIGVSSLDTTLATTVRAVIMAVFLVIASLVMGKARFLSDIDSRALTFIFLAGIAGALSWLFYFLALKNGPASGVVAIDRLSLVIVVVLAVMFLGERASWQSAIGAVLMVTGAVLLSIK